MSRRTALAALAALAGAALASWMAVAEANDRTVFSGCVTARDDKSITLKTSGGETIPIDTTWLKPTMYDALTEDCVTVTTMIVDGRYVAESVEDGDEPNEVHNDRDRREKEDERDEKDDDD